MQSFPSGALIKMPCQLFYRLLHLPVATPVFSLLKGVFPSRLMDLINIELEWTLSPRDVG